METDTKIEMIEQQGRHKNARIKIGITIYNDFEYLAMLLQSIRLYTYIDEPYDVVVCDDCSRDDMREKARDVCAEYGAVFLEHAENMGVAASWNHLVLSLNQDAEINVILNNDILVVPNWLRVGVHFSDTNKDNPQIGSCFWQPVNRVSKDMMKLILPTLGSTTYTTKDTVTNDNLGFVDTRHVDARVGEFQGIGKCMAPAGCSFLVRKSVFEEIGMFDEQYKAFFEESIAPDRYMVVKDSSEDVYVETVDSLFHRFSHTKKVIGNREYVYPVGLSSLSAISDNSDSAIEEHWMTPKEQAALNCAAPSSVAVSSARVHAKKKLKAGLHVNTGVWDSVKYIVRHKTTKPLLEVRNKMGASVVTPDHSMIVYDEDSGELIGAKPKEMNDRSLERVWTLPEIEEISQIDIAEYVSDVSGIKYDDTHIWFEPSKAVPRNPVKFIRFIDVGTPEMDALCEILGAYISEGSVSIHKHKKEKGGGTSGFIHLVCGQEREWCEIVRTSLSYLTDANSRIQRSKKKGYKDIWQTVCSHRVVLLVFQALCGKGSRNKRIPRFVFHLPKEHSEHVVDAMIHGDGFRPKGVGGRYVTQEYVDKYFLYTTNSRGLIADLSLLLCSFGIKYTIGHRKEFDSYWIRSTTKVYTPRFYEPRIEQVESSEYVYDLGTVDTHRFVDAEGLILVHNSDWGTRCAVKGRAAFGFAYPRPYHTHSGTFSDHPELGPIIMPESRALYRAKWGVQAGRPDFEDTHEKYMSQIPKTKVKFLQPTYDPPYEEIKSISLRPGGEIIEVPRLIEIEEEV